MVKIHVKHLLTTTDPADAAGTAKIAFYAPSNGYTGVVATEAGVDIPTGTDFDQFENYPACSVEEILKTGAAVRKVLVVEIGGRLRRHKIIVAKPKADTFDAAAKGKSYRGGTIKKVINPLKAYSY